MAAYTCLWALLLILLSVFGGFVLGPKNLSFTYYTCAGPKDIVNGFSWHHLTDILASSVHRQQYARSRRKSYFVQRTLYYGNSTATTQFLLLKLSGNVESNPGPQGSLYNSSKTLCACCAKAMRRNQNGVRCSSCSALFGKISVQPHTIVKQICFPNGNVLFLSLFSLSKNWMHNVGWGWAEILPLLYLYDASVLWKFFLRGWSISVEWMWVESYWWKYRGKLKGLYWLVLNERQRLL